jgi:hypothetical protein
MKIARKQLFLLTWIILCVFYGLAQETGIKTKGAISLKAGGIIYKADSTHSRGYGMRQSDKAFISAANKENMLLDVKWNGFRGTGIYVITRGKGEAELMLNLKIYSMIQADDYLKITITSVKEKGALLLLNGIFEGRLQDKKNSKVIITEGKFETYIL